MKKIVLLFCVISLLSGCGIFSVHKLDVIQGNFYTEADIKKLHKGMHEGQVLEILGRPVLVNVFTPNRVEYIYTYQKGDRKRTEKELSLIFKNGTLFEMHYAADKIVLP